MLICKDCYDKLEPEQKQEHFSTWNTAEHVYEQCEVCQRSARCAEL
jgi:RNase P subunit RPR2